MKRTAATTGARARGMADEKVYAVLSGDIVGSGRFSDRGPAIRDAIKAAGAACVEAFEETLEDMPPVDVFAGDSWQMLLRSPGPALRVGLLMRALIKSSERLPKADTRLAIGIGTVDFVDHESASEGQGEAFGLSGAALDALQDIKVRMAARVPETWRDDAGRLDVQDTLDTMMVLVDAICTGWTGSQATAMAGALMGLEQTRIAEQSSVSQPAISQALSAGNWAAIAEAVAWWETQCV